MEPTSVPALLGTCVQSFVSTTLRDLRGPSALANRSQAVFPGTDRVGVSVLRHRGAFRDLYTKLE